MNSVPGQRPSESARTRLDRLRLAAPALVGLAVLGACASFRHAPPAAPPPPPPTAEAVSTPEPQTVTEAFNGPDESGSTTTVLTDAGPALNASAPMSYVVKRGDTLWGIANLFLKDPWVWPEIWYVNPQIRNPHRIYPGDTVRLAQGRDGRTSLQVVRTTTSGAARLEPLMRREDFDGPIATIPYSAVATFLSHPGVMPAHDVKHAPYVVGFRGDNIIAGTGNEVYVLHLDSQAAGARYNVMHLDAPLEDPDGKRHDLGYLMIYAGTARLDRPGSPAKATLIDSARETLVGDVLVADDGTPTTDFVPHPPTRPIAGRVMAVVDNVLMSGQFNVVALNRGSSDGLERGHVLTVESDQRTVADPCAHVQSLSTCGWHGTVTLPREGSGSLLVFKTYERMSYALVLKDLEPIHVGDHFRQP